MNKLTHKRQEREFKIVHGIFYLHAKRAMSYDRKTSGK